MGKIKEKSFGKLDTLGLFMQRINEYNKLPDDEQLELIKLAQAGDVEAKNKVIESNLRLVVHLARGYTPNTTQSLLDLIQEGTVGLVKAVERFDTSRGAKFSTYAAYWIKQAISQSIADFSRSIRLPNNAINLISHMNKKKKELEELGIKPDEDILAQELDVEPEVIRNLKTITSPVYSLEFELSDEEDANTIADLIPDTKVPNPEEAALDNAKREGLLAILTTLDEREYDVLTRRFGLLDGDPKTLDEVGKELGITKERVRQVEIKGIRKLRSPYRQKALRDLVS